MKKSDKIGISGVVTIILAYVICRIFLQPLYAAIPLVFGVLWTILVWGW